MEYYTLDRLEDNDKAVLVDYETGEQSTVVDRCVLPTQAAEGDVFACDGQVYTKDEEKTGEEAERTAALFEKLIHGKH